MNSEHPPRAAVWLVEHAPLCGRNQELAGDLFEDFRLHGSVLRYWGETGNALLALSPLDLQQRLSRSWSSYALALSIASGWTYGFSLYWETAVFGPSHLFLNVWLARHAMLLTVLFAVPAAALYGFVAASGLSVYLLLTRTFNTKRYLQGVSLALMAGAAETSAWIFLARRPLSLVAVKLMESLWTWFSWQPLLVVLLLCMWLAQREAFPATAALESI